MTSSLLEMFFVILVRFYTYNLLAIKVVTLHFSIGKIELNEVSYLIFVQECTEVTKIGHNDSPVWKIDKVCYLPLTIDEQGDQTEISLHTHQNRFKSFGKLVPSKFYKANANNLIDDLIAFFNFSTTFYFSTEYDITKTLQK
jgi:hypothetical protein